MAKQVVRNVKQCVGNKSACIAYVRNLVLQTPFFKAKRIVLKPVTVIFNVEINSKFMS